MFAELALRLSSNYVDELTGALEPSTRMAGLWWMAGNALEMERWARVVCGQEAPDAYDLAGCSYLLGDDRAAIATGLDLPPVHLARVRLTGEVAGLQQLRADLAQAQTRVGGGPHLAHHGEPLTPWDWIEESFLLEAQLTGAPVPSHLEMLRICGVLVEEGEPRAAVPEPLSPEAGLRVRDGALLLEVLDDGQVRIIVRGDLVVLLLRHAGLWAAAYAHGPEDSPEYLTDHVYPDWRHAWAYACEELASWGEEAAGDLRQMLAETVGDPGQPIGIPAAVSLPPQPGDSTYPHWSSRDSQTLSLDLQPDLHVDARDKEEGWSVGWATDLLELHDFVIRGVQGNWRDALTAMQQWFAEHRGGDGVAEIQAILDDPEAHLTPGVERPYWL